MADHHEDGGYPYDTVAPLPPEYECPICQGILHEPQLIVECGHRYCKECLEPILRDTHRPLCPLDRQTIQLDKVFLDKACKRAVLGLQVKCLNSRKGCQWTGELLNAQTHRDTCPLEKIKCSNYSCEEMIERRDEQRHCEQECIWRIKTCPHCNQNYTFCKEKDHMDKCQQFPISCPKNCGLSIPRGKMTDHINESCPETIIECPYSATGCKIKINRCELQKHLEQSTQSHLDITIKQLQQIYQENKELRQEIKDVKERQLHDMKDIKERLQIMWDQVEITVKMRQEIKDLKERLYELEGQSSKYGKLIWRIDNYEQRLSEAKAGRVVAICSDPFYSGRYGYKVMCRLALNGEGDSKGSHVSIFIKLLQGECDSLLPWPFSGKVKFTLIDQTKENNDMVKEMTPKGEDNFQRPKTEQNLGIGYKFASHESIQNGGYLKDGVIFIKVEVKPYGL